MGTNSQDVETSKNKLCEHLMIFYFDIWNTKSLFFCCHDGCDMGCQVFTKGIQIFWPKIIIIKGIIVFCQKKQCPTVCTTPIFVMGSVTVDLLICTLISGNRGLEKSRSASKLRKISGPANLDFFTRSPLTLLYLHCCRIPIESI